ncbi:MAG: SusC/RagA family TonB-linked outer membrane protein [Dysgonamonadaceae bacterium]|nr:SusC/RagA family TonB-linked outer membrane protein [Dysgonamonadaceae bacterium]
MKITYFLLFFIVGTTFAESYAQKASLSLKMENASIAQILEKIESQTDFQFYYNSKLIDSERKTSINVRNENIFITLNDLFEDSNVSYKVIDKDIILTPKQNDAQNSKQIPEKKISGTVKDRYGSPLIGASVAVKGGNVGTATDIDGGFSLTVPENATLVFTYIGYISKEIKVEDQALFLIQMDEDDQMLKEVVVTALGIKREEKSLGYAVQGVNGNSLQTVKGVDISSSLTGKISGLTVKNSTEFNGRSVLELRGETSLLLVINGVPYANMTLRDIPADDIEDISMLKGPTAAALYGARGSSGAIMVTTKKGKDRGLSIDFNSNNMFTAGYTAIPEVQTSYGHGLNGKIANDYVWGPKLDIGQTAMQWNPKTKQNEELPLVSSGKNNLKNFMQQGIITNNNISVTQTGENGYFRANLNYTYNKGQFPNQKLNIINYSMSGEMKITDKFSLESQMGYSRSSAPNVWGSGYNNQGYIYQLLMWTGPDYDIRDYKDYWIVPHEKQNWLYTAWYDNPYVMAYEKLVGLEENKMNASLVANYNFTKDLKLTFRNGYDYYKAEDEVKNPAGIYSTRGPIVQTLNNSNSSSYGWSGKGLYGMNQRWGQSLNSDLMLNYSKSIGQFDFDVLGGASLFYFQAREMGAKTVNGLAIPGWYSLANAIPSTAAGVDAIAVNSGNFERQVNSVYGKLSIAWNHAVYVDVTGRNDWSSTQPEESRSYFYPSVAGSVILSEFFDTPHWLGLWKVRGSWTIAKSPLGIYESNLPYSTTNNWGYISAALPTNLAGTDLLPSETRTWEIGTGAYLFSKRLYVDIAYFDKLYYNQQTSQDIAPSSGYAKTLINTDETYARRGVEVTLAGDIIKNNTFSWNSMINYSYQHRYYVDIDPVYSKKDEWTQPGKRMDYYAQTEKILRDPDGNWIHASDGRVMLDSYRRLYGYSDPKFSFGFINTFKYKNWTLGINIDGRIGGLLDNYIYGKMFDTGSAPETDTQYRYDEVVNGNKYIGNGVKIVGGKVVYDTNGRITEDSRVYAPNDIPVSYQQYMRLYGNSWENRIQNKTFIKLREMSLAFQLPNKWLANTGIKNASFAITGQNLFLWTKEFKYSDPDIDKEDMNSPSQRMIGFDIKIGL